MAIYSTEETKIGTWIDGRPLYRIYIDIPILNNKYITDVKLDDYGINASEVRFMEVYKKEPSGIVTSINPAFVTMAGDVVCRTILYEGGDSAGSYNVLRITPGSGAGDFEGHTAYAILTYTKKTD